MFRFFHQHFFITDADLADILQTVKKEFKIKRPSLFISLRYCKNKMYNKTRPSTYYCGVRLGRGWVEYPVEYKPQRYHVVLK